jgi:hypothetical protein
MTIDQAAALVTALRAASFAGAKQDEQTFRLYERKFQTLDYELARDAVDNVIDDQKWWPTWAQIRKAYLEQAAVRRRQLEHQEATALLAEPTDAERREQLALMQTYIETRWATRDFLSTESIDDPQSSHPSLRGRTS